MKNQIGIKPCYGLLYGSVIHIGCSLNKKPPKYYAIALSSSQTLRSLDGMACKFLHGFSFATDLAANFGCDQFRNQAKCFPGFCSPPSEVAVLLNLNLSRFPFQDRSMIQICCFAQYSIHIEFITCRFAPMPYSYS